MSVKVGCISLMSKTWSTVKSCWDLNKDSFEITVDMQEAAVIIVNTCALLGMQGRSSGYNI